jgi:peptidoglycan/LPS O-acetylase OafA/YrhL
MSISLIAAALLTVIIGVAHSWIGEQRLIGPLLAPDNRQGILVHRFARKVLRMAWHVTTLAWWGIAAVLAILALSPVTGQGRMVLLAIGLMFLVSGLVSLFTLRGRHLSWPVFLAIGGLSLVPLV